MNHFTKKMEIGNLYYILNIFVQHCDFYTTKAKKSYYWDNCRDPDTEFSVTEYVFSVAASEYNANTV